jgi:cell division protein FtsW (lipid II flippase)
MTGSKKTSIGINELDFVTLTCFTALVITGWLMIYTVHYNPADQFAFFNLSSNPGKQLFFIVLCAIILFFIQITDWTLWRTFALPIYLASILLLAGTLVFGKEINGNNAWYQFGGFSLQPAELVKFTTCLAMAGYLSSTGVTLRITKTRLYTFGLFLLPVIIIVLQKDAGSALVFFSFVLVLYREGLPSTWYALGFGTAFMVILGLLFQAPNVVAWLMMVANFQLIRNYRNTRPWWIVFAALVPVIIWWPELAGWAVQALSGKPLPIPEAEQGTFDLTALLVMAPPLALLIAAFIPSYFRKNNLIQRRIQLLLLLLALAGGLVFLSGTLYKAMAPHQQQRIRIWLHPAEAASRCTGLSLQPAALQNGDWVRRFYGQRHV